MDIDFSNGNNNLDNTSDVNIGDSTRIILNGGHYSVNVSIEPNHEFEIQEIKYDGEEIYKEPLSQSENLAMLINKIDFNEELSISYADEANLNTFSKDSAKLAKKFHRNIFDKVKHAYDEICVLQDCLQIGYFNSNLLSLENSEEGNARYFDANDKILNGILKKKNIEAAKNLIKKSLDKIISDLEYTNNRFHVELYRVRQFWRIKKLANKFIGDFSYRSIGCLNALRGNFEILKNDYNKQQQIDVSIPEEYEEEVYIRVKIVSNNFKHADLKYSIFQLKNQQYSMPSYFMWHQQLENAQNSIYAKELFNQILREAFDLQTSLRPLIIGNSIRFSLINKYELIISLEHQNFSNLNDDEQFDGMRKKNSRNFNNSFLEHTLYQLLRNYFNQTFTHIDQRPVTSVIAYNYPIKLAGLNYSKDYTIKRICILSTIKDIAEHLIVRNRILKILNEVSKEVNDPLVIIEPFLANTSTTTDIRISIVSSFYEAIQTARLTFCIKIKNLRVTLLSQASTITFTDNIESLKSFLLDQCSIQQISCIQELSKVFNWTVLANGTVETNFHVCPVLLLWNSMNSKKIAIKLGPVNKIEIFLKKYNTNEGNLREATSNGHDSGEDSGEDNIMINLEWLVAIQKSYSKVDIYDAYPGRTLISKFELFLADLAFN